MPPMLRKIALYFSVSAIAIPITALALCYGLLCSERFVLEYLLPYISETIGTKISASRASISPLHRISLGGVRVNCKDSTPCPSAAPLSLSASSIEITYDLRQLFSRKISITSLRGERIEGSFISGPEHDKPSSPSESLDRSPKTSADSPPTLTINLANINLLNSSFRYVDTSSNGHYTFDAINVEIPKAQSHGNSEIKLSTRVSITSESLKLRDELISGSLTLSDSTFFVPRTIAINADAGSAIPRALQLKGSLDFRKEPYALESIRITKATVRDSLIEALGLPRTQISEFEVDLLGEHSLSGAQPTRATLKVHKAVLPSSYDSPRPLR